VMKMIKIGTAVALTALAVVAPAKAALISNGSFDSGDFSDWNPVISDVYTYVDNGSTSLYTPYGGNTYYALFGDVTPDTISQTVATTPGASSYDINFWLNDTYGAS